MRFAMEEQLSVRDQCSYFLVEEEPAYCRWWGACAVRVSFPPGEAVQETLDGEPVENAAVIAAELNEEGRWKWVHLTPAAKLVFGSLLFDQHIPPGEWRYVVEVDQKLVDAAEEAEDAGDEG